MLAYDPYLEHVLDDPHQAYNTLKENYQAPLKELSDMRSEAAKPSSVPQDSKLPEE